MQQLSQIFVRQHPKMQCIASACTLALSMWSHNVAAAQPAPFSPDRSIPDQQLLRQRERERSLREHLEEAPRTSLESQPSLSTGRIPVDEHPCFTIHKVILDGEQSKSFQWLVGVANREDDPAVGRCLGGKGISIVMARMQNVLINKGYVTSRISADTQGLESGVLHLTLALGKVDHIGFAQGTAHKATSWNALPLKPGDIVNLRIIEQALENFKRVPTVDADIQIVPGQSSDPNFGESDLVIKWQQQRKMRYLFSLDDSGSRSTGRLQANATWSWDDPLHLNDLFYVSVSRSVFDSRGDSHGYTVHYSLPFGYWLVGLTTSGYYYKQPVHMDSSFVNYWGRSANTELRISRIVARTAHTKTGVYVRGWGRGSRNYLRDEQISLQHRVLVGWEAGMTYKQYLGAATIDASLGFRHGTGAFGSIRAPEEDLGEGTSRPQLYIGDIGLFVPFKIAKQNFQYTMDLRGQWNRNLLIAQDRFAIGGRFTVRGFDGESTLTGDRGWLVRNDIKMDLGGNQQAYVGVDTGYVGGPSVRFGPGNRLAGAVLGLNGSYKTLSWDVFVGSSLWRPKTFVTDYTVTGFTLTTAF